jgi:hypothetical protein
VGTIGIGLWGTRAQRLDVAAGGYGGGGGRSWSVRPEQCEVRAKI